MERSDLLEAISARTPADITMLFQQHHGWAYFDCIAALDDNFADLVRVAGPFFSWPATFGPGRWVGLDSVEMHRNSEGWQMNKSVRNRHRSLSDENHASEALAQSG